MSNSKRLHLLGAFVALLSQHRQAMRTRHGATLSDTGTHHPAESSFVALYRELRTRLVVEGGLVPADCVGWLKHVKDPHELMPYLTAKWPDLATTARDAISALQELDDVLAAMQAQQVDVDAEDLGASVHRLYNNQRGPQ